MTSLRTIGLMASTALACAISSASHAQDKHQGQGQGQGQQWDQQQGKIADIVNAVVAPLMSTNDIPGMSVGIIDGDRHYIFNYGVASKQPRKPVTSNTLFELGSVSKTFTATLAAFAQVHGHLSLADPVSKFVPVLKGSEFGKLSVLNLGTHTSGGMPLQVPDAVGNDEQLLRYLDQWQMTTTPGTSRTYSNVSTGALGWITAKSMGRDFDKLIEHRLFPALGLKNSYINIPTAKQATYAQGYKKDGTPIRMAPGQFSAEAYGIKSTPADMVRFVRINMDLVKVDDKARQAVANTHTGYFQAGPMTQDLMWEQYPYPVTLPALLEGNSAEVILNPTPVTQITPPQAPRKDVWINKTGSTNGFGAYVAFIPQKKLGIVILANKNFPIPERITAAHQVLTSLAEGK